VYKGAPLSITAVVLGPMELLTELGLVVLRDVESLLKFVSTVSKRTLKFKNKQFRISLTDFEDLNRKSVEPAR
jgi:hypothetical protein